MPFQPYTKAAQAYGKEMTKWLQDTRLMSEAVFRLQSDYKDKKTIAFSPTSWPKPQKKGELPLSPFEIKSDPLSRRTAGLLKALWMSRFIFLEVLWEEYLQDVVLELRSIDVSIFEPFCERKFMTDTFRDVLRGDLASIDEIKNEVAARFATGITRSPWKDQWAQLARLMVGLGQKDAAQPWFKHLDTYFEMRNCIIHRHGRVSSLLHQKNDFYSTRKIEKVEIWPQHLDFYRWKFLDCVNYIESRIQARFGAKSSKAAAPAAAEIPLQGVS